MLKVAYSPLPSVRAQYALLPPPPDEFGAQSRCTTYSRGRPLLTGCADARSAGVMAAGGCSAASWSPPSVIEPRFPTIGEPRNEPAVTPAAGPRRRPTPGVSGPRSPDGGGGRRPFGVFPRTRTWALRSSGDE